MIRSIERSIRRYSGRARSKGLRIDFRLHVLSMNLLLHRAAFEQATHNLLDNALNYTDTGCIFISTSEDAEYLRIDIQDTGRGILREFIERAFHPFSQEDEGYSRSHEGLGLGLSLVQRYLELSGASITVDSKIGEGSTFSVFIPTRR